MDTQCCTVDEITFDDCSLIKDINYKLIRGQNFSNALHVLPQYNGFKIGDLLHFVSLSVSLPLPRTPPLPLSHPV